jgi:hypothetical protein
MPKIPPGGSDLLHLPQDAARRLRLATPCYHMIGGLGQAVVELENFVMFQLDQRSLTESSTAFISTHQPHTASHGLAN